MISGYKELALEIRDNLVYYKLRHKPTGLFYQFATYRRKSNLSKTGQLYIKKPIMVLREGPFSFYRDKVFDKKPIILNEWEIITYKVKIQAIESITQSEKDFKEFNDRKRSTSNITTTVNTEQGQILEDLKNAIKRKIK